MERREIKFRAWHSGEGYETMFSAEEMGKDELTLLPDGRGFINVSSVSPQLSQLVPKMIPMQFTGLKDQKGKEIYEGDILKGTDGLLTVEFRQGMFCFKEIVNPCWLAGVHKYTEIIGNIYENPELLQENATTLPSKTA